MSNVLALQAMAVDTDAYADVHDWSTLSVHCCDGSYRDVLNVIGTIVE